MKWCDAVSPFNAGKIAIKPDHPAGKLILIHVYSNMQRTVPACVELSCKEGLRFSISLANGMFPKDAATWEWSQMVLPLCSQVCMDSHQ